MTQPTALASIQEAAKLLNVSTKTLRRWEARGVLIPVRTDGGHRRYDLGKIKELKAKGRKIRIHTEPVPAEDKIQTNIPVLYSSLHIDQKKVLKSIGFFMLLVLFIFAGAKLTPAKVKDLVKAKVLGINISKDNNDALKDASTESVLAAATSNIAPTFSVNIESAFNNNSLFTKDVAINGDLTLKGKIIGNADVTGDVIVGGGDITTTQTVFNIINTSATTLNIGGAGTTIGIGAATGTTTVNNNLNVKGTGTITGKLSGSGDLAIAGNATFGNITSINGLSYSFPTSQASGLLTNNGSGTLTWGFPSLTSLSGVLPITNGGTNNSSAYSAGSVIFSNGTKLTEDNAYFFYDGSNHRLGLGTTSPTTALDVSGSITGTSIFQGSYQVCDSSGANCPAAGSGGSKWQINSGTISPFSSTLDVLIGGTATASSKFAFKNVSSGTPTASISGTTTNVATFIDGNGNISTTNRNNLTLGNSSTYDSTGNIVLNPNGTGNVGIGNNSPTTALDVTGAGLFSSTLTASNGFTLTTGALNLTSTSGTSNLTSTAASGTAFAFTDSSLTADTSNLALMTFQNANTGAGTTVNGLRIVATGATPSSGTNTENLISLSGTTLGSNTFNGIYFNTGLSNYVNSSNWTVTAAGAETIASDLGVNGGNITTTQTTANIFTGATTLGIGNAAGTTTINGALAVAGASNLNGNSVLGDAITDNITFTGRVAQDSDLLPIGTTGTNDLGSALLPWDNVYAVSFNQNGNLVCDASGTNCPVSAQYWNQSGGALFPVGNSVDVLIGSSATTSAKFAFKNVNSGTPTASISGTTANVATYLTGEGNLATTNFANLTLGGATTGNIILNPSNSIAGGYIAPNTTNVSDLGTASLIWRNIYGGTIAGTTITQGGNAVCDTSGANCPTAGAGGSKWRLISGAITPFTDTLDVLIGSTATNSAKFAFKNVNSGIPTATIAGTTANVATYLTGEGNLATTNFANLTLGGATTGNIIVNPSNSVAGGYIAPAVTDVTDLGVSGSLEFRNVFGKTFTQNGNSVCDSSGNCASVSSTWQLNNKVVSPANSSYDLAIGGTATGSAFQVFGLEIAADATSRIAKINSTAITTGTLFEATASAITSGNIIKLGSGGDNGNFTGNGIYMDFDNTGGSSFTGNFLKFDNAASTKFTVDSLGNIGIAAGSSIDSLTAGTLGIGTSTANAVSISKSGVTTTVNGALTSTETLTASNGLTLTTGALNLTSTSGTSSLTSTSTSGDSFAFTNNSLSAASANLANFTLKNNNTGAGISVDGVKVSATGSTPSGGTNTINLIDISATALANNTFNGINFGNGLTNYINGTNFTVTAAGNIAALGGMSVSGGTINLNYTGTSSTNIGNTTGTTTVAGNILPATTNSTNLGSSSSLQFNTVYANAFTQNGNSVCDASGANCPTGSSGGSKWKLSAGAISPFVDNLDVLIGSSATTSAKFAFKNVAAGTPTASISGSTSNVAIFIDGNGNISSTNRNNLTLGNSATYDSTGNVLINPNGSGNVGIGTSSPQSVLDIRSTSTQTSGTVSQLYNQLNATPTVNGTAEYRGIYNKVSIGPTYVDVSKITGIYNQTINGNVNATDIYGLYNSTFLSGAAGATATNLYGIYLSQDGLSPTNGYGIYLGTVSGTSLDYGIYQSSANNENYFAGKVGIGNSTPTANLDVTGTASISGTLTLGNGSVLQPAYGPLTLNYKSGANTWGTGLLLRDTSGDVEIAGGSGSTGCTVTNSSGDLTCSGTISATGIAASTVPFSGITSGTNTVAAMIVDTGASLNFSNSGTINASSLLGATWAAPGTIGSGTPNTGAFTTLTSNGASTLGTGTSLTNTFGSGASSINTIGSTTTPGALTLHGATTLDNSFTISGNYTASISGVLTVGNGTTNTIQSPYGPLNLAYKSGANAWTTGLSLTDTTGDVVVAQDLAVNGGDLTTSQTTATLFNTTATTLSLGGAATTALNLGNGSGNYTAINLGSGAGTHTINIAGTGATAADTINIGTGGTAADTINIGSSASTTAINLISGTGAQTFASSVATGTTTSSAFVFTGNSLTSGTGMYLNSSSLTTGDLLSLNVTGSTLTTGNLFNVKNNGSSVFSIGASQITSALPHQFTAAGDVTMAYDLIFTNQTASTIDSYGPLTLRAGESFESNNLTLTTYNSGNILLNTGATAGKVGIGAGITPLGLLTVDSTGTAAIGKAALTVIQDESQDIITASASATTRFKVNSAGNTFTTLRNSDTFALCHPTNGAGFDEITDCAGSVGADYAEMYPVSADVTYGDIVTTGTADVTTKTGETIKQLVKTSTSYQSSVIGIVSDNYGDFTSAGYNIKENDNPMPVALSGRVPVKVASSSDQINPGDYVTTAPEAGKATKATQTGRVIGIALNSWTPGTNQDTVMVYVNNTFYLADNHLNPEGNLKVIADNQNPGYSKLTDSNGNSVSMLSGIQNLIANTINSLQINVDSLLVRVGLISPEILTHEIKSLAGETDINIKLGTASESGKLAIKNEANETVASIDSSGSAEFKNASVSGDIHAGTLYADQIIARNANVEDISANTLSGITRQQIEDLLTSVEQDRNLLNQAQSWSANTATGSASLHELDLSNLYVTGITALNKLAVTDSVIIGSDLAISKLDGDGGSLIALDTIDSPLSIQSSASQPLYIMAGKFSIDTSGNVQILGNLAVGGVLSASAINIAEDPSASISASLNGNTLNSLASAGQAEIASGSAEIVLNNPNIKADSLIFVTPTSPVTESLYVKSEATGSATIGFKSNTDNAITFNWWIVGTAN